LKIKKEMNEFITEPDNANEVSLGESWTREELRSTFPSYQWNDHYLRRCIADLLQAVLRFHLRCGWHRRRGIEGVDRGRLKRRRGMKIDLSLGVPLLLITASDGDDAYDDGGRMNEWRVFWVIWWDARTRMIIANVWGSWVTAHCRYGTNLISLYLDFILSLLNREKKIDALFVFDK